MMSQITVICPCCGREMILEVDVKSASTFDISDEAKWLLSDKNIEFGMCWEGGEQTDAND